MCITMYINILELSFKLAYPPDLKDLFFVSFYNTSDPIILFFNKM